MTANSQLPNALSNSGVWLIPAFIFLTAIALRIYLLPSESAWNGEIFSLRLLHESTLGSYLSK